MAKYLISFPSAAMVVPAGELESVGRDAHAVIEQAKAAGVYVFAGGIDETIAPVLVSANGTVSDGGYPCSATEPGRYMHIWHCLRKLYPDPVDSVSRGLRIQFAGAL